MSFLCCSLLADWSEIHKCTQPSKTQSNCTQAVLESKWPSTNQGGRLRWAKLRNVLLAVSQFRQPIRQRQQTSSSVSSRGGTCQIIPCWPWLDNNTHCTSLLAIGRSWAAAPPPLLPAPAVQLERPIRELQPRVADWPAGEEQQSEQHEDTCRWWGIAPPAGGVKFHDLILYFLKQKVQTLVEQRIRDMQRLYWLFTRKIIISIWIVLLLVVKLL